MPLSTSESSQESPGPSGGQERGRSLSWGQAEPYYDGRCPLPSTSEDMARYGPGDEQKLLDLYHELLDDNIRLWECVNIVRSGSHRESAENVLRRIYAMSTEEFQKKFPTYNNFTETGHGSLRSQAPGGGCCDKQKTAMHLLEHNNGLLRENARLKHCLHLLAQHPGLTADEVVSRCFRLDDESFIKYYPRAERDGRLLTSLSKLREEEKKRHRTMSLPGHLVNFPFLRRGSSNDRAGPSYTNNNDSFLARPLHRKYSPPRAPVDPMHGEDYRLPGNLRRPHCREAEGDLRGALSKGEDYRGIRVTQEDHRGFLKRDENRRGYCGEAGPEPRYVSRATSPSRLPEEPFTSRRPGEYADVRQSFERRPYNMKGVNEDRVSSRRDQSDGRTLPYMVSQHPYNWATSNNSSIPVSLDRNKDADEAEFQPEDDEDNGVAYRKYPNATRQGRSVPFTSDYGLRLEDSMASKISGPKISFSKSPAVPNKSSVTKSRQSLNQDQFPDKDCARSMDLGTPKRPMMTTFSRGSVGKKSSLPERKILSTKSTGKRSCPVSGSLRKVSRPQATTPVSKRSPPDKRAGSETRHVGRNVTFEHTTDRSSRQRADSDSDARPIRSLDQSTLQKDEPSVRCRPMYYKPPGQRDYETEPEYDFEDNHDLDLLHRHPWLRSPLYARRRPEDFIKQKTSTPLAGRLSRSLSDEIFRFGDEYFIDPDLSREELLAFRDSYRRSLQNTGRVYPLETLSPDSLQTSPTDKRNEPASQYLRIRSPDSENRTRLPDLLTEKTHAMKEEDRGCSGLYRISSDPNLSTRGSRFMAMQDKTDGKYFRPQKGGYFLSGTKPHRTPTPRHPLPSAETQSEKTVSKIPKRIRRNKSTEYQRGYHNENTNRDSDSSASIECSGHLMEDVGHLDFPHRVSCMESGENIIDRLLKEKQQLYLKYQNNSCLDEDRLESYHSDEGYSDDARLHGQYQHESDMHGKYQDRSGIQEKFQDKSDLPEEYNDKSNLHEIYKDTFYLHPKQPYDPSFRRRSRSDPSPRPYRTLDFDSRKQLSFSDHFYRTHVTQHPDEAVTRSGLSEATSDESMNDVRSEDQYAVTIDRLREETRKMKDRMAKCWMDRGQRVKDVPAETPLIDAYLGYPVLRESKKNRSRSRAQADLNFNARPRQPSRHCSSSLTYKTTGSSRNRRGDSMTGSLRARRRGSTLNKGVQQAGVSRKSTLEAPSTLLGEVAYQLENRIIREVFKEIPSSLFNTEKEGSDSEKTWPVSNEKRHRFYGFTVLNLPQKIRWDCRDLKTGKRDTTREARLLRRYQDVITYLRHNFAFHVHKHGTLCQQLIQKHGVFPLPPDVDAITKLGLHDFRSVRNHVIRLVDREECPDIMVLLDCLRALSLKEAEPILCFR